MLMVMMVHVVVAVVVVLTWSLLSLLIWDEEAPGLVYRPTGCHDVMTWMTKHEPGGGVQCQHHIGFCFVFVDSSLMIRLHVMLSLDQMVAISISISISSISISISISIPSPPLSLSLCLADTRQRHRSVNNVLAIDNSSRRLCIRLQIAAPEPGCVFASQTPQHRPPNLSYRKYHQSSINQCFNFMWIQHKWSSIIEPSNFKMTESSVETVVEVL